MLFYFNTDNILKKAVFISQFFSTGTLYSEHKIRYKPQMKPFCYNLACPKTIAVDDAKIQPNNYLCDLITVWLEPFWKRYYKYLA